MFHGLSVWIKIIKFGNGNLPTISRLTQTLLAVRDLKIIPGHFIIFSTFPLDLSPLHFLSFLPLSISLLLFFNLFFLSQSLSLFSLTNTHTEIYSHLLTSLSLSPHSRTHKQLGTYILVHFFVKVLLKGNTHTV